MVEATATIDNVPKESASGYIGRIPVRNLWLLMFYASDLFRHKGYGKVAIEETPDDIPDLVAEHLVFIVERRLMRNLSFGYRSRDVVLNRVRGRIDLLKTERHRLLDRGQVACRYEDLTINTPRNCYVRAALDKIAGVVRRSELSHRCRSLAASLKKMGVTGEKPSKAVVSTDRFARHDSDDQVMVAAAHLAFDLFLPTEQSGPNPLLIPEREIRWIRKLYEKAVVGFYKVALRSKGWRVHPGKRYEWQVENKTDDIDRILPQMITDIVLDNKEFGKRIVIDTKFTSVLKPGHFRAETLRSGYIYQIYAYLRSQVGNGDPLADKATGLLLYPSVGETVDEAVLIQGHAIRFATVDLGGSATEIRDQLLRLTLPMGGELFADSTK